MILGMEHPWCETDTLLAMALALDEQARCPRGHHMDGDGERDPDVDIDVKTVVCPECAALEEWQRRREKDRPPAGTLTYTVRQRSQARERRARKLAQASRPR